MRRWVKLLFLLMFLVIPRDHAYAQLVWNPTLFAPVDNPIFYGIVTFPDGGTWGPTGPTIPPGSTLTGPDGGTWTIRGITLPPTSEFTGGSFDIAGGAGSWNSSGMTINNINITGTPPSLTFNGVPMGGTCTGSDFVHAISSSGVPSCATPSGGPGGGPPLPLSISNGGLGQGNTPGVGQILIATSTTTYMPVTMTGDATIDSTGRITVISVNGQTGPFAPLNTSAGTTPPANPITGQQWYNTTTGQIEVWNGTTWVVAGGGGGGVSVGPTPPPNPTDGQLWFDPTSLQTYIWYTDPTSSQWVAVVNIGVGMTSPIFSGTVTFPDGSTWGSTGPIVASGSKITGPDGGTWTSSGITLPATSEFTGGSFDLTGGGGSWNSSGLTLPSSSSITVGGGITVGGSSTFNGPITFTGQLTYPDGSYYDVNGHEVMKNLGVGVVAQSDGASAGDGLVSGNSITVAGGWYPETGPNDLNAYWDSIGINLMYEVNAQYIQACAALDVAPTSPNDVEMLVQTNPASDALENPWGQYTIQNYGAPPTPLSGNTQTWQAEGLEFINSVGIHGDTWGNAIPGCTYTGVQGASLSDCAVAARSSDLFDNVNYKMIMYNPGLGTNSQASYTLRNSANMGGLYLTGVGFTATVGAQPSQLILATDAPNGIVVGPSSKLAVFNTPTTTNAANALDITASLNGSVNIMVTNPDAAGTGAQAAFGANAGYVGNNLWMSQTSMAYNGGYITAGSGYIYDDSDLYLVAGPKGRAQINFAMNNTVQAFINPTGMNVNGSIAINSSPVMTAQIAFTPVVQGQCGGVCTPSEAAGIASRVGNHVTASMSYVATCPAMCGWLQISGLPWRNTNNVVSSCAMEAGGLPFDLNYWLATCRMLPNWDGCLPVEITSNAPAVYYNSALVPPGQNISIYMTCNYPVDTLAP